MSIVNDRTITDSPERDFRLDEFSRLSGYRVSTLRAKIRKREIGYRKIGRIIVIPQSELERLRENYLPPLLVEKTPIPFRPRRRKR